MSKIGKQPVKLPDGVKVTISGSVIELTGPKGTLALSIPQRIAVEEKDGELVVSAKGQDKATMALHGTYRSLINNMAKGVTEGWKKELELVGTGYRAEVSGVDLKLAIGYSHPVVIKAPEGITFKVEKSIITIEGADKELVGLIAARVRGVRPPEPYKGKGIKYIDEEVRRKPGKAAKTAGGGE